MVERENQLPKAKDKGKILMAAGEKQVRKVNRIPAEKTELQPVDACSLSHLSAGVRIRFLHYILLGLV